jgi:hypothetical protein
MKRINSYCSVFVASCPPVVPICNALASIFIFAHAINLIERYSNLKPACYDSNKNLGHAVIFFGKSQYLKLLTNSQRRSGPYRATLPWKRKLKLVLKIVVPTHCTLCVVISVNDYLEENSMFTSLVFNCAAGHSGFCVRPNVRAKAAPTVGRQAQATENVHRTRGLGLVARRWGSA